MKVKKCSCLKSENFIIDEIILLFTLHQVFNLNSNFHFGTGTINTNYVDGGRKTLNPFASAKSILSDKQEIERDADKDKDRNDNNNDNNRMQSLSDAIAGAGVGSQKDKKRIVTQPVGPKFSKMSWQRDKEGGRKVEDEKDNNENTTRRKSMSNATGSSLHRPTANSNLRYGITNMNNGNGNNNGHVLNSHASVVGDVSPRVREKEKERDKSVRSISARMPVSRQSEREKDNRERKGTDRIDERGVREREKGVEEKGVISNGAAGVDNEELLRLNKAKGTGIGILSSIADSYRYRAGSRLRK